MKRIFRAKINKFFWLKEIVRTNIKRKKLFETAEWLKKIGCWLTKMGSPWQKNNYPSLMFCPA